MALKEQWTASRSTNTTSFVSSSNHIGLLYHSSIQRVIISQDNTLVYGESRSFVSSRVGTTQSPLRASRSIRFKTASALAVLLRFEVMLAFETRRRDHKRTTLCRGRRCSSPGGSCSKQKHPMQVEDP